MGGDTHTLPPALDDIVSRWFDRYGDRPDVAGLERLVACSEFAGATVLRNREWFLDNAHAVLVWVAYLRKCQDPRFRCWIRCWRQIPSGQP